MKEFGYFVSTVQEYLWSFPMLFLLFGTHVYFTVRLKFIQKKLPKGIIMSFAGSKRGGGADNVSPYSALSMALAATIGTGNIVGISTAIAIGGPGAVFWCWVTGFLGIATCYAECFLAVKYRKQKPDGSYLGGPMYVLEHGLKKKGLAVVFAFCTVLASFGIGSSVQSHSIRTAAEELAPVSSHVIGLAAGVLAGVIIVGGKKKIAGVCTWLVPVMSVCYLAGCFWIIGANRNVLPQTVGIIFRSAFSGQAALGGIVGRTVMTGMRIGISRGLFTNEAGLGSTPMAAAATKEESPIRQGLISMTGPFWDTVVLCAITGIAIVSSIISHPSVYDGVQPERMCFVAFSGLPVGGSVILPVSLALFAFATIIGWNVYGTAAVHYLWGEAGVRVYQVLYMMAVYLGAVLSMDLVWGLSDLFNSAMAIPNLLALWMLRDIVVKESGC